MSQFVSRWVFRVTDRDAWQAGAIEALKVLQEKEGFVEGRVLHGIEDSERCEVQVTWESVGTYRRAVSSTSAKLIVWPFLITALEEPGAFETLVQVNPDSINEFESSLSDD